MIRRVAVILTITAMLWHAVVGCCAHHVHAAQPHDQAAAATDSHGCCGHHHHAKPVTEEVAAEPAAPSESDHDSDCSEQRCIYVTTSSDDASLDVDLDSQPCYIAPASDVQLSIVGDTFTGARRHSLLPDGAAMRRHLLLGVLRI